MKLEAMTDAAIARELGRRVRALRQRQQASLPDLADALGVPRQQLEALETGHARLELFIAVLRQLDSLDSLDDFLPDPGVSPLELVKMAGAARTQGKARLHGQPRLTTSRRRLRALAALAERVEEDSPPAVEDDD